MHCYACDKETDKAIYDSRTGRYYCRECLQPTVEVIQRNFDEELYAEEAAGGKPIPRKRWKFNIKSSLDLLEAAGFSQIKDDDILEDLGDNLTEDFEAMEEG